MSSLTFYFFFPFLFSHLFNYLYLFIFNIPIVFNNFVNYIPYRWYGYKYIKKYIQRIKYTSKLITKYKHMYLRICMHVKYFSVCVSVWLCVYICYIYTLLTTHYAFDYTIKIDARITNEEIACGERFRGSAYRII